MLDYIAHYGVGADANPPGRGSGRYPKGSGKRPRAGYSFKLKTPKNTKLLKGYTGPAYFISEAGGLKTLTPRTPSNYFTKNGYEDSSTKRVCFAPSVSKCLAGLSQNVEGKTFYVYSPEDIKSHRVYKPNQKAVPDSSITDELWITEPVNLKQVGKIKVTGNEGKPGKQFSYGDHTAELYDDWIYKETK